MLRLKFKHISKRGPRAISVEWNFSFSKIFETWWFLNNNWRPEISTLVLVWYIECQYFLMVTGTWNFRKPGCGLPYLFRPKLVSCGEQWWHISVSNATHSGQQNKTNAGWILTKVFVKICAIWNLWNIQTVVLCSFGNVNSRGFMWYIYPYTSGLLH